MSLSISNERVKSPSIAFRRSIKGEVSLNIKLHLNDSFYSLINKYHPHITKFCVVLKKFPNFEVILLTYKLVLLLLKIGTIYRIYLRGVSLYFC